MKIKGNFNCLLIFLFFISIGLNHSYALANTCDDKLSDRYFWTGETRSDVDDYVKQAFRGYSYRELKEMGFVEDEIRSLELYPCVIAYEFDECDDRYFYYPVVSNNRIIALFTAFKSDNNNISLQFGKTKMAQALNDVYADNESSAGLVITTEALYVSYDGKTAKRILHFDETKDCGEEYISISKRMFFETFTKKVNLSDERECLETYSNEMYATQSSSISENSLSVPFVSNLNINGGICWAACDASIIKYIYYPARTAAQLRDYLVANAGNYTRNKPATMEGTRDILSALVLSHNFYCYYNGWSSFDGFKSSIDAGIPVYSDWQHYSSVPNEASAHAMVIRGYYYNTSIPSSLPAAKRVTVMDPNQTSYISIYSNSAYNIGTKSFTMYGSVR